MNARKTKDMEERAAASPPPHALLMKMAAIPTPPTKGMLSMWTAAQRIAAMHAPADTMGVEGAAFRAAARLACGEVLAKVHDGSAHSAVLPRRNPIKLHRTAADAIIVDDCV